MNNWVDKCINKGGSKLTKKQLEIHGMTSIKIRHLLNNIMEMPGARYLEVGAWKGATLTAALYENNLEYAYVVDDFSAGSRDDFFENTKGLKYDIFIGDAFSAVPEKGINVFFWDAGKTESDIFRALEYYYPYLADEFIYIVDDFNCPNAQAGTHRAISEMGLKVEYYRHLGKQEWNERAPNEWWIGLLVSVFKK